MQENHSTSLGTTEKMNVLDKFILFFYALYFVLNPFYLWSSGLPQIADIVMIFSLLIYVFYSKFKFVYKTENKQILLIGLLFVIWIVIVNSIWMLILQEFSGFFVTTLFYIYNYLIFCFTLILMNKYGDRLLKTIYVSVLLSIAIQVFIYLMQGGFTGGRQTASFNNPNQLGYYALLMMSFLMFSSNRLNIKVKWLLLGLIGSLIFVFSSLSKAAIVSALGLIVIYLLASNSNKKLKKRIIITSLILTIFTGVIYNTTNIIQDNQLISSVQRRIDGIGVDSDDSLEGRGYYRIYEYPEYWLFGAGEGVYTRFRHQSMEFHSTLGNIQVSYGIVGSILFMLIVFNALKKDGYKSWYIILSLMTYGLTHNGIRNSLLWILFAIMATSTKSLKYF